MASFHFLLTWLSVDRQSVILIDMPGESANSRLQAQMKNRWVAYTKMCIQFKSLLFYNLLLNIVSQQSNKRVRLGNFFCILAPQLIWIPWIRRRTGTMIFLSRSQSGAQKTSESGRILGNFAFRSRQNSNIQTNIQKFISRNDPETPSLDPEWYFIDPEKNTGLPVDWGSTLNRENVFPTLPFIPTPPSYFGPKST